MVGLVEMMLKRHKELPKARTPHDKELIERQISATDRVTETLHCAQGDPAGRIDSLVYELYGLTEPEIRVVEGELR